MAPGARTSRGCLDAPFNLSPSPGGPPGKEMRGGWGRGDGWEKEAGRSRGLRPRARGAANHGPGRALCDAGCGPASWSARSDCSVWREERWAAPGGGVGASHPAPRTSGEEEAGGRGARPRWEPTPRRPSPPGAATAEGGWPVGHTRRLALPGQGLQQERKRREAALNSSSRTPRPLPTGRLGSHRASRRVAGEFLKISLGKAFPRLKQQRTRKLKTKASPGPKAVAETARGRTLRTHGAPVQAVPPAQPVVRGAAGSPASLLWDAAFLLLRNSDADALKSPPGNNEPKQNKTKRYLFLRKSIH